ncbi:Hypothetical protein I5071_47850 [Sandaracinus amylolyticus]|nr:Hypothetical protein I5071_47850 [Sandaracinus amylolyticus]
MDPEDDREPQGIEMQTRARGDGSPREALEQLRDILFGGAQRELDRKLKRIDSHVSSKTHDVEDELKRRTDLLQGHFRRELDLLITRFDAETSEAREQIRALAREHREAMSSLDQRLAKMEEMQVRAHRELRDRILEQAKASLDEVRRVRDDVAATLDRELGPADEAFDEGTGRGTEPRAH